MPSDTVWINFIQNAGFAAVVLLAVGVALWRVGKWAGVKADEWITPLVRSHLTFIANLERKQEVQTDVLKSIQEQQTAHASILKTIQDQQVHQTFAVSKQSEIVAKLLDRVETTEQKSA